MRLDRWFLGLALVVMAGCQCGAVAPCGPGTCEGCCFAGECFPGDWNAACGEEGRACQPCSATGLVCVRDVATQRRVCAALGPGGSTRFDAGVVPDAGSLAPDAGPTRRGINDFYGAPCSATNQCVFYGPAALECAPIVRGTGVRSVCQFPCQDDRGCVAGARCIPWPAAAGVCFDCVRSCSQPSGQQEDCEADELCTLVAGQPGCVPDCHLVGARCPMGSTCRPDGLCAPEPIRRCENY